MIPEAVQIDRTVILSEVKYSLRQVDYRLRGNDGQTRSYTREVFDKGDGAVVLPYCRERQTIILTRQLRLPVYLTHKAEGFLLEACAGTLEPHETPGECIIREALEETGYRLPSVERVFEAYMSPGAVTEKLYFFIAAYTPQMKESRGGGIRGEEEIEVLEMPFAEAWQRFENGGLRDAKTILLLQYLRMRYFLEK